MRRKTTENASLWIFKQKVALSDPFPSQPGSRWVRQPHLPCPGPQGRQECVGGGIPSGVLVSQPRDAWPFLFPIWDQSQTWMSERNFSINSSERWRGLSDSFYPVVPEMLRLCSQHLRATSEALTPVLTPTTQHPLENSSMPLGQVRAGTGPWVPLRQAERD